MIVPIATSKLLPLNDPPTSDICHTPVRPHGAQPRAARGTGASAFSTDHATSNRFAFGNSKARSRFTMCIRTSISTPRRGGATARPDARRAVGERVSHEETSRGLSCARTHEMQMAGSQSKVLQR